MTAEYKHNNHTDNAMKRTGVIEESVRGSSSHKLQGTYWANHVVSHSRRLLS